MIVATHSVEYCVVWSVVIGSHNISADWRHATAVYHVVMQAIVDRYFPLSTTNKNFDKNLSKKHLQKA